MKKTSLTLISVLALSLLVPAAGLASLPKPKHRLIEVPSSIGGVELKQRIKRADRAWHRTGDCDFKSRFQSCLYEGKNPRTGRATIDAAVRGKVSGFTIEAGLTGRNHFAFKTRLRRFQTKEGIGLGDRGKKVPKAYPRAIKTAMGTGYIVEGKGKSYMTFQTLDKEHITAITVVDGKHQG